MADSFKPDSFVPDTTTEAPPARAPLRNERDVVGRAKAALTREPPAGARTMFGETDMPGRIVRAAGDLFLPGSVPDLARTAATLPIGGGVIAGPLKRTLAGGLAGAGAALAQGREYGAAALEGGSQALSQFAGEILPSALRFGVMQRTAKPLLDARAAKGAHDTAMHGAVTTLEEEGFKADVAARRSTEATNIREARARHQETTRDLKVGHERAQAAQDAGHAANVAAAKESHVQAARAYATDGAQAIAEAFKRQVSAWAGIPANERGLLDMVYGKGQRLLSQKYDEALRTVVQEGHGHPITLTAADAGRLGVPTLGAIDAAEGTVPRVFADAGQVAAAVTGRWRKDPGLYRRVAGALDEAGIGDPKARGEYRAGQALIQFTDKTQMLKGERFNPEAARAGFTKLKTVDELRRRSQGNIFEGPVASALERPPPTLNLPPEPTPLTPPTLPVFRRPTPSPEVPKPPTRVLQAPPMPEGVKTKTLPKIGFWEGAALAEIPFLVAGLTAGQHHYTGYGLPAAAGGLLGRALSGRTVATEAPISSLSRFAVDAAPPLLAQESRRLLDRRP